MTQDLSLLGDIRDGVRVLEVADLIKVWQEVSKLMDVEKAAMSSTKDQQECLKILTSMDTLRYTVAFGSSIPSKDQMRDCLGYLAEVIYKKEPLHLKRLADFINGIVGEQVKRPQSSTNPPR